MLEKTEKVVKKMPWLDDVLGFDDKKNPITRRDRLKVNGHALLLPYLEEAIVAVGGLGTPANRWSEKGDPDPHGNSYNQERAKLALGHLTDDELASGIFMNYDQWPKAEDMMKGNAFMPIAWMSAGKERIRWLSRQLVDATQRAVKAEQELLALRAKEETQ